MTDDPSKSLARRFPAKRVREAIVKCDGRWAAIAAELNCSYGQLRTWMTNHPDDQALAEGLRDALVDAAEQQMCDLMNSPDESVRMEAAKFVLKHFGWRRGWNAQADVKQTVTAKDGAVEIRQIFGVSE